MIKKRTMAFLPSIMTLVIAVSLISGCSDINSPNMDETNSSETMTMLKGQANGNKVVHRVSVGSNDACEALELENGCDANFSLVALQSADGTTKGQWQDTFKGDDPTLKAIHVAVDCMIVEENSAIIGGVITKGAEDGFYATGTRAVTKVVDNGNTKNDPDATSDQISFSYWANQIGTGQCSDWENFDFDLLELNTGQVKVN